jgi:hypothetical protein
MFDPVTILAALGPLAVDLGKSLINRYVAPDVFKPATIDDYTKMRSLDLEMFKAMNDAGGSNQSYPWVEAIVRMQRPFVAAVVLATWAGMTITGQSSESVNNFAAAIGFYLFGDRTLFYTRKQK